MFKSIIFEPSINPVTSKHNLTLSLFLLLFLAAKAQKNVVPELLFTDFPISGTEIRAIEVVNDSLLFFAGSHGFFGSIDKDMVRLDSIKKKEDHHFHFRSVAFNGKDMYMLSIESPAHLYKVDPFSEHFDPQLVYSEDHLKVFYDALLFKDALTGFALGDPVENCFSVLKTIDGGSTWKKVACEELPAVVEGEAAFAASNSNLAAQKNTVWFVSGGKKARVFRSRNNGINWEVFDTPMVQGESMTGIFTCDFYDENKGIIMGGNYDKPNDTKGSKALTKDGGKTWELIADGQLPGYISCVRYIPGSKGKKMMAVASSGIYYSDNSGVSWKKISEKPYNTVRFLNKNVAWLGGNKIITKVILNDQN